MAFLKERQSDIIVSVSKIKSDARNLASLVDEQLSICRALRSDATVQQVLNLNQEASTALALKQCAYLVLVLKADIRALHEKVAFGSDEAAADVFHRTRELEDMLHQQNPLSSDPVATLSGIVKLLELKESLNVKILTQILKEKNAFYEESRSASARLGIYPR